MYRELDLERYEQIWEKLHKEFLNFKNYMFLGDESFNDFVVYSYAFKSVPNIKKINELINKNEMDEVLNHYDVLVLIDEKFDDCIKLDKILKN